MGDKVATVFGASAPDTKKPNEDLQVQLQQQEAQAEVESRADKEKIARSRRAQRLRQIGRLSLFSGGETGVPGEGEQETLGA